MRITLMNIEDIICSGVNKSAEDKVVNFRLIQDQNQYDAQVQE